MLKDREIYATRITTKLRVVGTILFLLERKVAITRNKRSKKSTAEQLDARFRRRKNSKERRGTSVGRKRSAKLGASQNTAGENAEAYHSRWAETPTL